ncbi:MAG: hypothetical protein ORN49_03775, partial [Rhodobacteraceae bacterium]|nr:hypothetical protein [Paracoccaceae bacterium]
NPDPVWGLYPVSVRCKGTFMHALTPVGGPDPAPPSAVEGQLLAHRKVLGLLVAMALRPHHSQISRLCALVSTDASPAVHDEDPGAEPDRAFALQAGLAEELREIAREAARWFQPEEG